MKRLSLSLFRFASIRLLFAIELVFLSDIITFCYCHYLIFLERRKLTWRLWVFFGGFKLRHGNLSVIESTGSNKVQIIKTLTQLQKLHDEGGDANNVCCSVRTRHIRKHNISLRACIQIGKRKSNKELCQLNYEISDDMKSAFNNYHNLSPSVQVKKVLKSMQERKRMMK